MDEARGTLGWLPGDREPPWPGRSGALRRPAASTARGRSVRIFDRHHHRVGRTWPCSSAATSGSSATARPRRAMPTTTVPPGTGGGDKVARPFPRCGRRRRDAPTADPWLDVRAPPAAADAAAAASVAGRSTTEPYIPFPLDALPVMSLFAAEVARTICVDPVMAVLPDALSRRRPVGNTARARMSARLSGPGGDLGRADHPVGRTQEPRAACGDAADPRGPGQRSQGTSDPGASPR